MRAKCPYCAGEVRTILQPAMTWEECAIFEAIGRFAWGVQPSKGYIKRAEKHYHYEFYLQPGDIWISGVARWFPGPTGIFEVVTIERSEFG